MRDFLTVTKALFKANYGMDLKSKQGKKGIAVAAVLVICLLPTFALLFNMFQTGFATHTVDLLIMEMGFLQNMRIVRSCLFLSEMKSGRVT